MSEWKPGDVVAVRATVELVQPDYRSAGDSLGRVFFREQSCVPFADVAPWTDAVRMEALEALREAASKRWIGGHQEWCSEHPCWCGHLDLGAALQTVADLPGREGGTP